MQSFHQLIKFDLNLFPNIEKLNVSDLTDDSLIPKFKTSELKKLELDLRHGQEHMLRTFIDNFPKLTHFNVIINSIDENTIFESLKNISNLKHLIHFHFDIHFGKNDKRFYILLKQMANNCKNLKSIECGFDINDKNSDVKELLSQLKTFPLKRLNLRFGLVDNEENFVDIDVNQLFSLELLKGFSNITHLSLRFGFYSGPTLKESILKEIDINLPKLQYLEIYNTFEITAEEVKQMAEILSRLSRLETLKLRFKTGVDFKPIEEKITEKCRKIRNIEFRDEEGQPL